MGKQKKVTEADVRKAVQRAFKHVVKEMGKEPVPVIEPGGDGDDMSEQTLADIGNWLFKRRQKQ